MKLNFSFSQIRRRFCLRYLMLGGLIGLGCILGFYAEENWRGHRAWTKYVREKTAQGLHLDWEDSIPPEVPDAENFAMTPLLAALYDFKPGTQENRDLNAPGMLARITQGVYDQQIDFADGDWLQGEHFSWSRCLTNYMAAKAPKMPHRMSAEMAKRYGMVSDQQQMEAQAAESIRGYYQDPALVSVIQRYALMSDRERAQEIIERLEPLKPVWEELRTAMKRPLCRYPTRYEFAPGSSSAQPHLPAIKKLSAILRVLAIAHLEVGQPDSALADLELGFHLSASLKNDLWLMSYRLRGDANHLLTQAIWEGTSRHLWSAAQLERLQQQRPTGTEVVEARRMLLRERALGNRTLQEWATNFKVNWSELRHTQSLLPLLAYNGYFLFGPKGWFDWEKLHLSQMYDEFVPKVFILPAGILSTNEYPPMRHRLASQGRDHPYWHHTFFTMLSTQLELLAGRVARAQAANDLAYLGCALERYRLDKRAWPVRLDDLAPAYIGKIPIDVLTGQPYRYRLMDGAHFALYSPGPDGKDDLGTAQYDPEHKTPFAAGDWIWLGESLPAETKPERGVNP